MLNNMDNIDLDMVISSGATLPLPPHLSFGVHNKYHVNL